MESLSFSSIADAVEQYVTPALGAYAADYDAKAIVRSLFDFDPAGHLVPAADVSDGHGGIDPDSFWAAVSAHDLTGEYGI